MPLTASRRAGVCTVARQGYEVHGIIRRTSTFNTSRIEHIYKDKHDQGVQLFLHYGDLTDSTNLMTIIAQTKPDEIYNLGAMSHVKVSFEMSEYTADVDGIGTLRLLNAIRACGLEKVTKYYQASTSELYGKVQEIPQTETTPFYPRSPYGTCVPRSYASYASYAFLLHAWSNDLTRLFWELGRAGVAKQFAFWTVVNYREAYNMFAVNGILFNHESPRRGPTFVTRKITRAVARIFRGRQECLFLGNLDSERDWGHAKDYVEGMWMMMQAETPSDYVLATNEKHSVREFVERAFAHVGTRIEWRGERGSLEEHGVDAENPERVIVRIDPQYFRPTEVDLLIGDPAKAKRELGWQPKVTFEDLVTEMVDADLAMLDHGGFIP